MLQFLDALIDKIPLILQIGQLHLDIQYQFDSRPCQGEIIAVAKFQRIGYYDSGLKALQHRWLDPFAIWYAFISAYLEGMFFNLLKYIKRPMMM
jgi:hypothetical protein